MRGFCLQFGGSSLDDGYVITDYKEAERLELTEDGIDDVDIYGEVDVEKFYEEMREHGVEIRFLLDNTFIRDIS